MPLVPLRPLMEAAEKYNYAQGAFNVNAVGPAKAVIEMHETFRSPAILQGADLANAFMAAAWTSPTARSRTRRSAQSASPTPSGSTARTHPSPWCSTSTTDAISTAAVAAIEGGYTSVMIDGSSLPLEQNIELTREVVKYAHALGVSVEGELGVLGGQEDHVFAETSTYTNPLDAVEFIEKTGVDALAISYGTQHGASKGKNAKLRREIAIAIKECINRLGIFCALVSHGSSTVPQYIVKEINGLGGDIQNAYGIPVNELVAAIPCGIRKINVDTDIRLAVTRNMKELFANRPELRESKSIGGVYQLLEEKKSAFDPRVFFPPIMDTVLTGNIPDNDVAVLMERVEQGVKEAVGSLIVNFGSYGRAPLVELKSLEDMKAFYAK